MPHVVVDTNVFISLLTDRNERQRALAKELMLRAETGEIVAALPQCVIFEMGARPSRMPHSIRTRGTLADRMRSA